MTCEDYDERNGPGIVEKAALLIAPLLASRPIRALARLLPRDVRKAIVAGVPLHIGTWTVGVNGRPASDGSRKSAPRASGTRPPAPPAPPGVFSSPRR